jgi:ferric-dicitrate binding protein FerR (iron transport regulator)
MDQKKSIKELVIAQLEGELERDEIEKLKIWIGKSIDNNNYYTQIKDIWQASLADVSRQAETEKEWYKFLIKMKQNYRHNIFRFNTNLQILYRIAVVLIIGLIAGGLAGSYLLKQDPLYITSVAPKGSVSQMILADSTSVYLNADSEIWYSPESKNKKREIFLKGEAWFDVTKQKNRPFVVHTNYYDVNVTGTQFNVKAYETDNEITTTLAEGQVQITSSNKYKLMEAVVLKPGEQLSLNKESNEILVKNVDTRLFTSWKDNKLMFLNMNFKELIILLERKFGVEIKVNNSEILKYHYSGTIKNESIMEILEIIKHTLPIQYKIEGQKIIINKI